MHILWRVQPFRLSLIGSNDSIPDQLNVFLEAHREARDLMFLDTLKAHLRGAPRSTIFYIKKFSRQEEEDLIQAYQTAETT